jgi:hypothetical protein
MNIRSITLLEEPDIDIELVSRFFSEAKDAFHLPVQTVRIALTPFPNWIKEIGFIESSRNDIEAANLVRSFFESGADYISLGPVLLEHDSAWLKMAPELLAIDERISTSAEIADTNGSIDVGRCHLVAQTIIDISKIRPGGFGNFGFAATANCPPGTPFFPVSYHGGGHRQFSIATESADLALSVIEASTNLENARENLIQAIEAEADAISKTALELEAAFGIQFAGIDFSLAPFPEHSRSLGAALEAVGLPALGQPGSLFSAAFLADTLNRARFKRCGFNGLLLPVLEDSVIAQRVAGGHLSIDQLLTFSAVCGIGLDIIPLPGNVKLEVLAGILLDIAALSQRLDKPLTARLLPIPGLKEGEMTDFDFPYFTDSRVFPVAGSGVGNLLSFENSLRIEMNRLNRSSAG